MRHWINLLEAPLADITVHGEPLDKPGSFSDLDRRYMARAVLKNVYRTKLAPLPFPLYVYVLNLPGLAEFGVLAPETEINASFLSTLDERFDRETRQKFDTVLDAIAVNRARDPQAIHFVLGDNYSDEGQVPPTPWIIVHRLMHAWLGGNSLGIERVREALRGITRLEDHLTFKSAASGSLQSTLGGTSEVAAEVATQHLLTGAIRLRDTERLPMRARYALAGWVNTASIIIDDAVTEHAGKAFYI